MHGACIIIGKPIVIPCCVFCKATNFLPILKRHGTLFFSSINSSSSMFPRSHSSLLSYLVILLIYNSDWRIVYPAVDTAVVLPIPISANVSLVITAVIYRTVLHGGLIHGGVWTVNGRQSTEP